MLKTINEKLLARNMIFINEDNIINEIDNGKVVEAKVQTIFWEKLFKSKNMIQLLAKLKLLVKTSSRSDVFYL